MESNGSRFVTLSVVSVWFVVALLLSAQGAFMAPPGSYPWPLLVAILGPVALYLVDRRWLGGALFRGIHALDRQALVALQVWRVGGLFFLVEWARGHLPGGFALPAGIGDILVGLTAPLVVALLARHQGERAFAWWNGLGLLDLVVAVGAGVLHASGPLGLLAGAVPSDMVARYPLSLVPTFLVPLAVILHIEGAFKTSVHAQTAGKVVEHHEREDLVPVRADHAPQRVQRAIG
jgi:hypothetical protein